LIFLRDDFLLVRFSPARPTLGCGPGQDQRLSWYLKGVNLSLIQKPSRYLNREIHAIHGDKPVKVALAFPDVYEIGMSHLGLRILYAIINDLPFASAERVFSPWIDAEAFMKANGVPLSSLESRRPLNEFDIIGFSLQYELSYTTVLNMLSLGRIPIMSASRLTGPSMKHPLVIAGGPCTANPLPMSPFIDAFLIGDGEDAVREIMQTYYQWKMHGDGTPRSLLEAISRIEGIYVPSLVASSPVKRRVLASLDDAPYPDKPIVPYTPIVHDRVNIEVSRGCSMGCRFCQAGMIYRPVRERNPAKVLALAEALVRNTGYEEIAFTSLNVGDYSCLFNVVQAFNKKFKAENISVSLPSFRVTGVNSDLLREISTVRKTGFTIAPEAGTERLRKVINKDFSDYEYEQSLVTLFKEGWLNLKMYFMIGLPTETDEDIDGILAMAFKALKIAKSFSKRFINISIGISPFVPKAHTPFQWYGQIGSDRLRGIKTYLRDRLHKKGFQVKGHSIRMSVLEAAFSRGDSTIAPLIETAWSLGCRLDGWTEAFDFSKWEHAMHLTGIDASSFARKSFAYNDSLPWDHIDIGISKEFLWREYQKALSGETSADCRKVCHKCGLDCEKKYELDTRAVDRHVLSYERSLIRSPQVQRFKPVRVRIEFSKTGALRYLSHLELMNVLLRAMRRSRFPIEFTAGFHPTPKVSFGPPLGVGIAGLKEYCDIMIIPPFDLLLGMKKLNETLPDGISVHDIAAISSELPSLDAFVSRYEYVILGADVKAVQTFLSIKEVLVTREKSTINVRNMVEEVTVQEERSLLVIVRDQGDSKVRLGELLPLLCNRPLHELDVTRTALFGWRGGWVKPMERNVQWTVRY